MIVWMSKLHYVTNLQYLENSVSVNKFYIIQWYIDVTPQMLLSTYLTEFEHVGIKLKGRYASSHKPINL